MFCCDNLSPGWENAGILLKAFYDLSFIHCLSLRLKVIIFLCKYFTHDIPRGSLTVLNHNHFAQISLMVLDFFWMQLPKLKNHLRIYSTESQARFTDKEVI